MTKPEKESKLITGLVKRKPFSIIPEARRPMLNSVVGYSLEEFFENTARIVRVPNLSSPLEYFGSDKKQTLCVKAYMHVRDVLAQCQELRNIPFTMVDGTSWENAIPSTKYSPDIIFVNVFWQNDKAVVAVVLGMRMIMKTHTLYQLEHRNRFSVMFDFDYNLHGDGVYRHVSKAVEDCTKNAFMFSEYGSAIAKGLTSTSSVLLEYPVAAASYLNDEVWYVDRPGRHHHIVHSKEYQDAKNKPIPEGKEELQGFLTNHGNFITRYRASYLAAANNMIINSENVNLPLVDSQERQTREIMKDMGGLRQMVDLGRKDYRVGAFPLFSEDLW